MHIVSILSIIVSMIAVPICISLYVLISRGDKKRQYLTAIGLLNLVVSVSMLIIVIATWITPTPNDRLSSIVILAGVVIVSLFILGQVFFLVSTRPSFHHPQNKQSPKLYISQNLEEPENLDDLERRFRRYDDLERRFREYVGKNFSKVPTVLSEISRDMKDVFVPTKAYDKPQEQRSIEIFTDPLDLLDKEYEQWLRRSENARDLLDILSRESRNYCVLLGEPGIGKTTFMKYLVWSVASTNKQDDFVNEQKIAPFKHLLPVYISLHEFATYPSGNLFEFIVSLYNTVEDMEGKFGELFQSKLVSGGKVLLLLDGLDEAYTGARREEALKTYDQVCRSISEFAEGYNKTELHLIVTSRKASYKNGIPLLVSESEEFKTLEMSGFLPNDVEQFITNEFDLQSVPQGANKLITLLQRDQRLREMSTNPLLLTVITKLFLKSGHITANRSELYKKCVDYYLANWDRIRAVERFNDFSEELKDTLLEELAWRYHGRRQHVFEESDLRAVIEDVLKKDKSIKPGGFIKTRSDRDRLVTDRVLYEIIANSGLLTKTGISSYGFTLFVFQEYFASRYVLNRVEVDQELGNSILRYWGDFWWEDVILMLAMQLSSTGVWLKKLMSTRDDFFNTSTLLAGRMLADRRLSGAANASPAQLKIIDNLFNKLNGTSYRSMSDEVVKTLVEVASPTVNRRLLDMLIENNKNQRSSIIGGSIIKYLGQWGNCNDPEDEAYKDLIKTLKDGLKGSQESDQPYSISIRRVILQALWALEGSAIIDFVIEFLGVSDQDSHSRFSRVWATDEAVLLRDMVRILKRLRVVEKITDLCRLLTSPPVIEDGRERIDFQIEVAKTLGVLGSYCQKISDRDVLLETLTAIIEDSSKDIHKDPQLRIACINALVRSRSYGMKVTARLIRLLNNDKQMKWEVRSRIKLSLVIIEENQPDMQVLLGLLLQNKYQSEYLESINNQSLVGIINLLIDLLFISAQERTIQKQQRPGLDNRLSLLSFIEENRAYVFVSALVEILYRSDIEDPIRVRIAEMLSTLGDEETARQLIIRLFDKKLLESAYRLPGEIVRSQVVVALGTLYDIGMVDDKSLQTRLLAGLGELLESKDTGIETLISSCRVVHQLGSKAEGLKEKVIEALERDILLAYPDKFIVLGNSEKICV